MIRVGLLLSIALVVAACSSTPPKRLTAQNYYDMGMTALSQYYDRNRSLKKAECRRAHSTRRHDLEQGLYYLEQSAIHGHPEAAGALSTSIRLLTDCDGIAEYWEAVAAYQKGEVISDENGWRSEDQAMLMKLAEDCVKRGSCRQGFTLHDDPKDVSHLVKMALRD